MNKFLKKIMDIKKKFQEQLFFRKHKVNSWEEYNAKYDPDYNATSETIEGLFHGYHSFHFVETHMVDDFFGPMPSRIQIKKWCEENCTGKYRIQGVETWCFDDCRKYGKNIGMVELFVAFKNKDDAISYVLCYEPEIDKNMINLSYGSIV